MNLRTRAWPAVALAALLALPPLLAAGRAEAQMVLGPHAMPPVGPDNAPSGPSSGPVLPERPAEGRAVNVGTGTTTGIYHAAGAALCRLLARSPEGEGVGCEPLFSAGSAENIERLKKHQTINFALVQSDVQYFAYRGERVFGDLGPTAGLRHVVTLQPEALTIVAGARSGIVRPDDLLGRRVNLGQLGSGTFVIREMLGTIDPAVLTIRAVPDLQTALSADALCAERIDAFAFVAGNPNPLVQQATRLCGAYLVPLQGRITSRLLATYPFYSRVTIPGGLYPNNPKPVPTVGVHATLITREDVDPDLVYRLTKAIYTNVGEFRRLHLAFADFTKESLSAACNTAPLHAGTLRYLKEAGIKPAPCQR